SPPSSVLTSFPTRRSSDLGDGIHGAVSQRNQKRFTIRRRTQWRVHLEIGIVVASVGVKQRKVIRSHFARDPRLRALAPPHRLERVSSRNIRHLPTRPRQLLPHVPHAPPQPS